MEKRGGVSDADGRLILWKEGEGEELVVVWEVSCGADLRRGCMKEYVP